SVVIKEPSVASKTYALPANGCAGVPADSSGAPTTTVVPLTATEEPNTPLVCALGLVSVMIKEPSVASKMYALPACVCAGVPADSPGAPTTTVVPLTATEKPNSPSVCAFGLVSVVIKPVVVSKT